MTQKTKTDRIIGKTINRWTVIKLLKSNHHRQKIYLAKCICGSLKEVIGSAILNGTSKSCGCLQKEVTTRIFRKAKGESGFNYFYSTLKRNAKIRNLEFDNSEEFKELIKELTKKKCYYCGIEPHQEIVSNCPTYTEEGKEHGKYIYNGIDRVDNSKGYIEDNVTPCCGRCNRAKDTYKQEEFFAWINQIYNFLNSKGKL